MCAIALGTSVSACGSEEDQGTIPTDQGNAVLQQLDVVQQRLDMGDCEGAEAAAQDIQRTIDEDISREVPADLEEALVQASDNLASQTRSQCEPPDPEPDPEPEPPTGTTDPTGVLEEDDG